MEDWAAVQRVYKQTGSKRETAKVLGIARNTVKKLLDMAQEPVYKRSIYPSKIDPFKEQIIEWRCAPYPCFFPHCVQHAAYHRGRDEGANAVVDGDKDSVGDLGQGGLDGMEAGHSAFNDSLGEGDRMLHAHLTPGEHMLGGKRHNNVCGWLSFKKSFNGALEDGDAAQIHELLGDVAAHAGAAAARYENRIYFPKTHKTWLTKLVVFLEKWLFLYEYTTLY